MNKNRYLIHYFLSLVFSTMVFISSNVRAQSVDFAVQVNEYVGDVSVVINEYVGDESWVIVGACSNSPNLTITINEYVGEKSVVINEYFGDRSVCITNADELDRETLKKLKLID